MNIKKPLFVGIGLLATAIGILGVWLPGIPTTFPLIVALWAFSKSSARLHSWVGSLPVLKQALAEAERFERERSIDWRVKWIAMGSAWVSTVAVAILVQNLVVTAIVAASALSCTLFMIYTPTRRTSGAEVAVESER